MKFTLEIQKFGLQSGGDLGNDIDTTIRILSARIQRFGVTSFQVNKLKTDKTQLSIEVKGVKDSIRLRKLLLTQGKFEFWETYNFRDLVQDFTEANKVLGSMKDIQNKIIIPNGKSEDDKIQFKGFYTKNPLFAYLNLNLQRNQEGQYYPGQGPLCGNAEISDTAFVNELLSRVNNIFPKDIKFAWTLRPNGYSENNIELIALKKASESTNAALNGNVIQDAYPTFPKIGTVSIEIKMNVAGAVSWRKITQTNIGNNIAMVLDNKVYSYPRVNEMIPNGMSVISGNFSNIEAADLSNIIKNGALPVKVRLLAEE